MLEIVRDINQYCGLTKNGYVVLKDSGVIWGYQYDNHHIDPFTIDNMFFLIKNNQKISCNMPKNRTQLTEKICQEEHQKALQIDYPLFSMTKGGEYSGRFVFEHNNMLKPFTIGDLELHLEWVHEGNVRVISLTNHLQYVKFSHTEFIIGDKSVSNNELYMGRDQILKSGCGYIKTPTLEVHVNLKIDKAIYFETNNITKALKTQDMLSSFLKPEVKLLPMLKNISKFCDIQKPDIDVTKELEKHQIELVFHNDHIDQVATILAEYKVPVPQELITARDKSAKMVSQLKSYDFDTEHLKVRKHFKDSVLNIDISGKLVNRLFKVLNDDEFSASDVKSATKTLIDLIE